MKNGLKFTNVGEYGLHPQTIRTNGFLDLANIPPGQYLMVRASVDSYLNGVAYFSDVISISPDNLEDVQDGDLQFSCEAALFDHIGMFRTREDGTLWAGGDGLRPSEDMLVCLLVPLFGWESEKARFEPALYQVEDPEWLPKFRADFKVATRMCLACDGKKTSGESRCPLCWGTGEVKE